MARWAVPAGAVAAAGLVTAGTVLSGAQAAPRLPARTAAQLLASVQRAAIGAPRPMTATVTESASLGLPSLPDMGSLSAGLSALSGTHTMKVWYADPAHVRVALLASMGETDLRLDGRQAWLWQSSSQTATHLTLPARAAKAEAQGKAASQATMRLTPQQAARQVLAAVGPTTTVGVQQNVTVAGQAAYQLVLAPRSSGSQIERITIALDAQHLSVPLRVQIFAKGDASPVFQVGYTSISFVTPAASNFDFTPPPGAHVHTASAGLPVGWTGYGPGQGPQGTATGMQVIGKDWTSVAVLPAADVLPGGALSRVSGAGSAAGVAGQAARSVSGGGGAISGSAMLGALLLAAHPVHGAWGSGKLLHTALVSMLITNGHVLIGAVTPSVLYAAAAKVK